MRSGTWAQTAQMPAQAVLDARAKYPTSTLGDLYDLLTLPGPLLQTHPDLDRAVDRCYRPEPFPSDRPRVEYVFGRASVRASPTISDYVWESRLARTLALPGQLTAPLVVAAKAGRKGRLNRKGIEQVSTSLLTLLVVDVRQWAWGANSAAKQTPYQR